MRLWCVKCIILSHTIVLIVLFHENAGMCNHGWVSKSVPEIGFYGCPYLSCSEILGTSRAVKTEIVKSEVQE